MAVIEFAMLAAMCAPNIHPTTLSALITQESSGNPYAIGINGGHRLPRPPTTLDEAVATAEQLMRDGHNFDAGLGQINVKNFDWLGLSVSDLFDPCRNLAAAQTVLADCYSRASTRFDVEQAALQAALSCYNTGNFTRGFANGYVNKVAGKIGVTVPALEPIENAEAGRPEPVKVRAVPKRQVTTTTERPREGLADAFSDTRQSTRDAFRAGDAFGRAAASVGEANATAQVDSSDGINSVELVENY